MLVFSGSSSLSLGKKVADAAGVMEGETKTDKFPDGEVYVRVLSDVKGERCVVIQSTLGNDALIELLITLDVLRDLGASRVDAVVPYLGYARQDKHFNSGEALSAKTILKTIKALSDSISTVNCHFLGKEGVFNFHGVRLRNLDAFPLVAGYFADKLKKPVVIAPDKGSLSYAKHAAGIIGCEFDFLQKRRLSGEKVVIETKKLDVAGKDALILDDMISTGGTIIESAKVLKKEGAASVNVGCVHGVFSFGVDNVRSAVDRLVCTDTIERDISKVSVSGLISNILR